ncbi:MAG TPA: hypothetical protein VIY48_17735 [Candidatus Paceibacterota bacterium]
MMVLALFYIGYTLFRLGLDMVITDQRKAVNGIREQWNTGKEWD